MQLKIVRGPRGVQMEEVWAAADAVLRMGERPTIERVRQQLGRGSPNTVGPMLDGWYESLAKRLQAPADVVDGVQYPENPLPGSVLRAVNTLWGRALQQAHESTAAQFSQARAELEERAAAQREAQEELKREHQRLEDRSEAYVIAIKAKDAQIAEVLRQAQELQQQLFTCQQQLDSTRLEGAQIRQTAEAERRRHEAKDAEHQIERSRIEEHAHAQERRLHAEVDRARQESRRIAQQLEGDIKKAEKTLTDSISRAVELDARAGALQTENAGLLQQLQSAREEVKGLQNKLDERSTDMLTLLNELRDRLPPRSTQELVTPLRRARRKRS